MSETYHEHIPVLLNEAIEQLIVSPEGLYIDTTFGRGSHSLAILKQLSPAGRLIAFDKDPTAIAYARTHIKDTRFKIYHTSFARLQMVLNELKAVGQVSGILFDLGVSSPQLDDPDRGFSFSRDGQLDMRMDTTQSMDALQWIANTSEQAMADVLFQYGEEKASRRIARAIVKARELTPITTTAQLAEIIKFAMPKPKKPQEKHPATRSFQAIRIAVNQELTDLTLALSQCIDALMIGGRLCVISFHSLEDRIVKQFIHAHEKGQSLPRGLPIKEVAYQARLQSIGKPIKPSLLEIHSNPRARSAILRTAEKRS